MARFCQQFDGLSVYQKNGKKRTLLKRFSIYSIEMLKPFVNNQFFQIPHRFRVTSNESRSLSSAMHAETRQSPRILELIPLP